MAFKIKRGATRPSYWVQLLENVGEPSQAPIDISDATGIANVYFVMRLEGAAPGDAPFARAVATRPYPLIGAAHAEFATKGGWVQYNFVQANTTTIGSYQVEFDLEYGAGVYETVPNEGFFSLVVTPDLGGAV